MIEKILSSLTNGRPTLSAANHHSSPKAFYVPRGTLQSRNVAVQKLSSENYYLETIATYKDTAAESAYQMGRDWNGQELGNW